jgi:Cof subfamily protein (haloacid dehalogenase superfamily)
MSAPAYRALLLDLDGTLLDRRGEIHPRNLETLRAAHEANVKVIVVTGRSKISTMPILERLGLENPAVIFNGAALWCPRESRLLEHRVLSNRTFERLLAYGRESDDLTLLMMEERKLCLAPRNATEERSLRGLHSLEFVSRDELTAESCIRVTFLSSRPADSAAYAAEVESFVDQPLYMTHFPLSWLSNHEQSAMLAVDAHPPCKGKGEALRIVQERWGISPQEVVAVGDACNDLPMVLAAGLGVAMQNSMPELLEQADRVIGDNEGAAIAGLIEELFLG